MSPDYLSCRRNDHAASGGARRCPAGVPPLDKVLLFQVGATQDADGELNIGVAVCIDFEQRVFVVLNRYADLAGGIESATCEGRCAEAQGWEKRTEVNPIAFDEVEIGDDIRLRCAVDVREDKRIRAGTTLKHVDVRAGYDDVVAAATFEVLDALDGVSIAARDLGCPGSIGGKVDRNVSRDGRHVERVAVSKFIAGIDDIIAVAVEGQDRVVASAGLDHVTTCTADDRIIARTAVDEIVARTAVDFVAASTALYRIRAGIAEKDVAAGSAVEVIIAIPAGDKVITGVPEEIVVLVAAGEHVGSISTQRRIRRCCAEIDDEGRRCRSCARAGSRARACSVAGRGRRAGGRVVFVLVLSLSLSLSLSFSLGFSLGPGPGPGVVAGLFGFGLGFRVCVCFGAAAGVVVSFVGG